MSPSRQFQIGPPVSQIGTEGHSRGSARARQAYASPAPPHTANLSLGERFSPGTCARRARFLCLIGCATCCRDDSCLVSARPPLSYPSAALLSHAQAPPTPGPVASETRRCAFPSVADLGRLHALAKAVAAIRVTAEGGRGRGKALRDTGEVWNYAAGGRVFLAPLWEPLAEKRERVPN